MNLVQHAYSGAPGVFPLRLKIRGLIIKENILTQRLIDWRLKTLRSVPKDWRLLPKCEDFLILMTKNWRLAIGLQPWSSIFQFRRTKSRIQFDNLFWFISLLSTTKKKFPKINLHDSELMTYVHIHGRQLPKLLLHIRYYHWWLEIPMGIWIIAS